MGIQKGLGDGSRREAIGLNQDGALGFIQFPNDSVCASAVRGEVDFPGTSGGFLLRDGDGRKQKDTKDSSENDKCSIYSIHSDAKIFSLGKTDVNPPALF
jgi:hypothetical protein